VASRPLRVKELAEFLGFDFISGPIPKYQKGWLMEDPIDAVLSTTSSLLAVVDYDGSPVIQFSHFSVKEFLTSSRLAEANDIVLRRYHIYLTHAHTLTAQACLGMLLHLDKGKASQKSTWRGFLLLNTQQSTGWIMRGSRTSHGMWKKG
jgi:hypothetical protein